MDPTAFPSDRARTLALAALVIACGGTSRAATPADADEATVPVRTVAVGRGPVRRPIRAAGVVAPKDEWDLSFKVGGLLAQVRVQEGERVVKGQVLAALDITELAPVVRQAREALVKAERERRRARLLRGSGAISQAAAEDAETAVALAAAVLESAELNQKNATMVAPDDGWVDRRLAQPGENVGSGRPVLHVSGRRRGFVVRASLPERDVLGLAPGDAAVVRLAASPEQAMPARISEISRSAARGTGTYPVEIRIDPAHAPRALLAGLTAKVEIDRVVGASGSVPLSALVDGDGASGAVYAVHGGRARRVPVRVAFLQGDAAILAAGIDGLDRVVAEGAARLVDGARVRVVP